MMPDVGQHVKCILRTGAMAEGIVEEWFVNTVQLRSLDGESILIIPHPNEDIMLIKIILEKPAQKEKASHSLPNGIVVNAELSKEIQDTQALPSDDPKRIETLAKLRIMLAEQEKKIITEKVKSHSIGDAKKVKYEYPFKTKK